MKSIFKLIFKLYVLLQLALCQWTQLTNSLYSKYTYEELYYKVESWYNAWNESQLSPFIQCTLQAQSIIYINGADPTSQAYYYLTYPSYSLAEYLLTLDLYFTGTWSSGTVSLAQGSWSSTITYTNPTTMPFTSGFCDSLAFDVQTYSFVFPQSQIGSFTITIVAPLGQVGVRNFHTSYLKCHYSCLTCFGPNDDQCLSCFSGIVVSSGKCSNCPTTTPYLFLYSGCQNYCDQSYIKDSNNICQSYSEPSFSNDYFSSSQLSSMQYYNRVWSQIFDQQYLNTDSKENVCSGYYFYGPFTTRSGASRSVNLPFVRQFPVRIKLELIILGSLQENSGIHVKFNNQQVGSLTYFNAQYILDNAIIIQNSFYSSACLSYQNYSYLTLLLTIPAAPSGLVLFTIIGNLSQPTQEAWGIRTAYVLVGQCPNYCSVCDETNYCLTCSSMSYTLSKGKCYYQYNCPISIGFVNSSNLCEPYVSHRYSNTVFNGFYEFTPFESMDSLFTLLNQTGLNFMKGTNNYTSYTYSKRIFGGPYVWAQAAFQAIFSLPNPHYAASVHFTIIFGSSFTLGNFSYQIESNPVITLGKSNCTLSSNQIGDSNLEYMYQVHELLSTHTINTLTLTVHCFGDSNSVQYAYCGIQDLFIVEHQCQPYCLVCTSPSDCTSWNATYDSSIIKFDGSTCLSNQYYSRLQYRCLDCPSLCPTCRTFEQCTSCISTFTLFNYQCVCQITQYLDPTNPPQCLDCQQPCLTCSSLNYCTDCYSSQVRVVQNGVCVCATNYYEETGNQVCQPCNEYCTSCYGPDNGQCTACLQLINFIIDSDTCRCQDNFYYSRDNKACEPCHYSCEMCYDNHSFNCLSCSLANQRTLVGLKCPCEMGFYEATPVSACSACPTVVDSDLFGCYKQCGDGSSVWFNGTCPPVICVTGYENQLDLCIPICGDGILVVGEDCDDTNSIQFDGCHNCGFQCSPHCTTCDAATAISCHDICGDGIVSGTEECDDGNNIQYDGCYNCLYQCQLECTKCIRGLCYECSIPGWQVNKIDFYCTDYCGDKIIVNNEQCDDDNTNPEDGCHNCRYQCRSDCLECDSTGHVCLKCQPGFEPSSYYCNNICGDGKIVSSSFFTEQCDDFNKINYDGCSSICKFQCQPASICLTCDSQQKCQSCATGYVLNQQMNKCEEICGDNQIIGTENCEDLNNRMYDGCYKCRYQCQIECSNCSLGGCLECNSGYFLNKFNNQCSPICGDKLIVSPEQCDDGNLLFDDGCHNCQFNCQDSCMHCINGKCYTCKEGYYLNSINECLPICGDNLIVSLESCDDGNDERHDGCYECNIECDFIDNYCNYCKSDMCFGCILGWGINSLNICQPICGDSIVINPQEECDDGNLEPYDGCFECKFQCEDQCTKCIDGICYECGILGWQINNEDHKCQAICNDGLILGNEECDDKNEIPYDGCYECKFQCEELCTTCIEGVCLECNGLGWQINKNHNCQPICNDGIVLGIEECDDMNEIPYDGCFECTFQCEELCTTCIEGICYECDILGWQINQNRKCEPICNDGLVMGIEECDDQNLIPYDGCYECKFQCHQQCHQCDYGVCLECNYGYYPYLGQCKSFCGDGQKALFEECDDGNLNDVDGCSKECQIEENWTCLTKDYKVSTCFSSKIPNLQLSLNEKNSTEFQFVSLKFDLEIQKISKDVQPQFSFRIIDLQDTQYQLILIPIIPLTYEAQFVEYVLQISFNISFFHPVLVVDVSNITNEYKQSLDTIQGKLQLRDSEIITEGQKQATVTAQSFSQIVIYSMGGIAAISALTGNLEIVWNLLDMLQLHSYIKFINIGFPYNLDTYFEIFKLITISPLVNYLGIDKILSFLNGGVAPILATANKFQDDEINAYFLSNFLSFILIFVLAYINYYFSKIMSKLLYNLSPWVLRKSNLTLLKIIRKAVRFFRKNEQEFYYSAFIRIFLANYYDVMFAACIQMSNLNWDDVNLTVNSALSILTIVGQAYFIFYIASKLYSFTKNTTIYNKKKYDSIFEGVKNNKTNFWGMQLNSILLLKKFIFMVIIVNCQGNGTIQTIFISIQSTMYLFYIIKTKPFDSKSEFIKQVINEITISFNVLIFMIYKCKQQLQLNYSQLMIIGWIQIVLFVGSLCSTLLIDIFNQMIIIFNKVKLKLQTNAIKINDQQQEKQNIKIENNSINQDSCTQCHSQFSSFNIQPVFSCPKCQEQKEEESRLQKQKKPFFKHPHLFKIPGQMDQTQQPQISNLNKSKFSSSAQFNETIEFGQKKNSTNLSRQARQRFGTKKNQQKEDQNILL